MSLWTDPSFVDTVATAQASRYVFVRVVDGVPQPPEIDVDDLLRCAARFILARDAVARLEAFSPLDFSGDSLRAAGITPESAHGNQAGLVHEAYAVVREAGACNLDQNLLALINGRSSITVDGKERPVTLPDAWWGDSLHDAMALVPRGVHGAVLPLLARNPTGIYSPSGAQHSAALLNELRAVRQAANVAIDAGLAASAAAAWTAARSSLLEEAQNSFPAREYI